MKRIKQLGGALVAAAALGVSSAAFVPMAANAAASGPSTWCTDGVGGETVVTNSPIAVAVEVSTFDWPDGPHNLAMVCWSTTPRGSSAPEVNGGSIVIWSHPDGTTSVSCAGDRTPHTVFTLDCHNSVSVTDPDTTSAGVTATGTFQEGPTSPLSIGQTGAEAGGVSYSYARPFNHVTQSGACLWALGTQLLPGCSSRAVDVQVHDQLWTEFDTGTTGTQCLVHNGTACTLSIPRYYQEIGSDRANPNVDGRVATERIYFDIPFTCIGFC